MGTTLDNGTYLPDEGERNCYDGLAGNWVALDNHLGSTDIHVTINDKQAWDGHVADTTIHVTSADKQTWNSHVADTTIHVTSADKQAWNGHVADSVKHVTAEDKNKWDAVTDKANDSDVVHKSGNETIAGEKTFTDLMSIDGDYLGTEISNNQRTNLQLRSNRDTAEKSGALITRFRQNRPQGGLATGDLQMLGIDFLENEVRTNNVLSIQATGWAGNVPTKVNIISAVAVSSFGSSQRPCNINNLNPSSLSLPDLDNGIDISSYITTGNTDNNYTPPVNGWIWIRLVGNGAGIIQGDFGINANYVSDNVTGEKWVETNLFVTKNVQATIRCRDITVILSAKFFPCLGNV